MHYSQHDNLVEHGAEVNSIREPAHQRSPRFAVDARMSERMCNDSHQPSVDLCRKRSSETGLLVVVPEAGVEEFGLGFRPKDKAGRRAPPASFRRTSSHGMAEALVA